MRREYIRHVTDQIMEHVIDAGITIFFPHTLREADRMTADIAEKMELTCKERKFVKIEPEMLEILNFEIENPMSEDLMSFLYNHEILLFLWKLGETDTRAPEEVLQIFLKAITEPIPIHNDKGEPTGRVLPARLENKSVKMLSKKEGLSHLDSQQSIKLALDVNDSVIDIIEQENVAEVVATKELDNRYLTVPACWTPHNKRANAAFIYIFFRNVSSSFLHYIHI